MENLKFIRNIELQSDEILLFESDINYSQIWLSNGRKLIVAKTLKQISEIVKNSPFVRVNRKIMLNANFVKSLGNEQTKQTAELTNGLKITFSRRRAAKAHNDIKNYLIN
ncbi:LytTR family transcriptional regulator [Lacihabitans sp. LS3-19]|uniref:LytTR family DNA-binding domain-containing protein n=1 Tax=Lacihabitans sp. LS3-19 TaxID=2487335 RepID=UPI0020CDC918|nr:LytTR family DNA-binding domain-containing protein [Lacihabitans sp. LS3-19]MCP9766454.1 LytTR family transcriptional regulator [Lacihabitans sp. LS3-19]